MDFLSWLGSIIAWVAGIAVLIKLFQKEGVLKGILGLICMLYTFIWGWMQLKTDEALKKWMYIWSGAIVVGIILGFIGRMGQ